MGGRIIPPQYTFDGDKDVAAGLTGFGQAQVALTHKLMNFRKLSQLTTYDDQVMLTDGRVATIVCQSVFGVDTVRITVPMLAPVQAIKEEQQYGSDRYLLIFEHPFEKYTVTVPLWEINRKTHTTDYFPCYQSASQFTHVGSGLQSYYDAPPVGGASIGETRWRLQCLSGYDHNHPNVVWVMANTDAGAKSGQTWGTVNLQAMRRDSGGSLLQQALCGYMNESGHVYTPYGDSKGQVGYAYNTTTGVVTLTIKRAWAQLIGITTHWWTALDVWTINAAGTAAVHTTSTKTEHGSYSEYSAVVETYYGYPPEEHWDFSLLSTFDAVTGVWEDSVPLLVENSSTTTGVPGDFGTSTYYHIRRTRLGDKNFCYTELIITDITGTVYPFHAEIAISEPDNGSWLYTHYYQPLNAYIEYAATTSIDAVYEGLGAPPHIYQGPCISLTSHHVATEDAKYKNSPTIRASRYEHSYTSCEDYTTTGDYHGLPIISYASGSHTTLMSVRLADTVKFYLRSNASTEGWRDVTTVLFSVFAKAAGKTFDQHQYTGLFLDSDQGGT